MNKKGKTGYLHVYTGKGKGKTTASLGLCLRAAGAGHRILFVQFLKSGDYSEIKALKRLGRNITVKQYGFPGFIKKGEIRQEHREKSISGLREVEDAFISGDYDMVIMDEACIAVDRGLITEKELLDVIRKRGTTETVVTGRNASPGIMQEGDLITEMREVRHYYNKGLTARKGIEL